MESQPNQVIPKQKKKIRLKNRHPSWKTEIISENEQKILSHLFKWKMTTTCSLWMSLKFGCTMARFYKKLLRLEARGYIQRLTDQLHFVGWKLTDLGFETFKKSFSQLKEDGYKSEHITHDFLTTAFHQGEWIGIFPKDVSLISEQYLRRVFKKDLPSWVPNTDIHRPDGFTYFAATKTIVAIEVELTIKECERYCQVAEFYENYPQIQTVLWLVKDAGDMERLKRTLAAKSDGRSDIHQFILLEDYKSLMWEAKVVSGQKRGCTLRNLYGTLQESCGNHIGITEINMRVLAHFKKSLSARGFKEIPNFQNFKIR